MNTPLEQEIALRIEAKEPDVLQLWTRRFLAGGAIYFLLGGKEVRFVAAAGAVYYLVQKKVIQSEKQKVIESVEEIKKRLFGGNK